MASSTFGNPALKGMMQRGFISYVDAVNLQPYMVGPMHCHQEPARDGVYICTSFNDGLPNALNCGFRKFSKGHWYLMAPTVDFAEAESQRSINRTFLWYGLSEEFVNNFNWVSITK